MLFLLCQKLFIFLRYPKLTPKYKPVEKNLFLIYFNIVEIYFLCRGIIFPFGPAGNQRCTGGKSASNYLKELKGKRMNYKRINCSFVCIKSYKCIHSLLVFFKD